MLRSKVMNFNLKVEKKIIAEKTDHLEWYQGNLKKSAAKF